MTRRQIREKVIIKLYQKDLVEQEEIEINEEINKLYVSVIENLATIDQTISNNLTNYKLNRLAYLDRAIIRLATYEMLYTDTSKKIIINEAIEITKKFTDIDDLQKAFTNKVLDNIKKSLGEDS